MHRFFRFVLAAAALFAVSLAHAKVKEGDVAPDYLGHGRDGHDVTVSGQHGKVVVVSFWASWCKYCRKELPVLAVLQKMKGTTDLTVVGVNHDDDLDSFRQLRRRWKDLDIILTYDAPDNRIGKPYGIDGLPYMVMIGRDGRIAHIYTGYGESMLETILADVNDLIAEPVPASGATTATPATAALP